ncbi:MAG: RNA ligase family protein [Aureispira sp.]
MKTDKYGRTYHLPFSKGVTNDDRVCWNWEAVLEQEILITEKLDGENTCLKADGVYARSHASTTRNPWAKNAWAIWERIGHSLGRLEIFGENLYGIHSIEYEQLPAHFFVLGIRDEGRWLAWEEVVFYAECLDLFTVPLLEQGCFSQEELGTAIAHIMSYGSAFGGACEGIVLRPSSGFSVEKFPQKVLKYVRENHVKTDEHWTKHWKRAPLWYEKLLVRE